MALINCPHCGKPVSDKAEKCVHCGVTFNKENTHSNPQDSEPAVVDEPKPKVKSDNSGKFFVTFYVAIIIIVVVAFLGLTAYFYYQFSTKDEVANSSNVEKFNNATCEHSDSLAVDTVHSVKDDVINERMADEAKSIRTMDLSAFMLHGKVKRVTETFGGGSANVYTVYDFNEQGKLIRIDNTSCSTSSTNNKYTLRYKDIKEVYTFDSKGRIIRLDEEYEVGGRNIEYSEYNDRGWPTKKVDLSASWEPTQLVYSEIDKYENWTQCEWVEEDYTLTIYREIEYYPIGQ